MYIVVKWINSKQKEAEYGMDCNTNEVLFFTAETENRLREAGLYPDIM
jgi:hypothetical protein